MVQLEDWFKSWEPDSVFSAGGGRGSVEAWYTSALDIEEVLAGATDSDIHLVVADVRQEPAPSKCVLMSTSRVVRKDMKDWVLSEDGDKWSVNVDVRDLCEHLDTSFRGWSSTLAARGSSSHFSFGSYLCLSSRF